MKLIFLNAGMEKNIRGQLLKRNARDDILSNQMLLEQT